MSRTAASRVLAIAGGVVLTASVLAIFVRDTLADSDEFGARAEAVFVTDEVRDAMTAQIVDQLVAAEPELLTVQPVVENVIDGVLRSDLASETFRRTVTDVHRTVFDEGADTTTLALANLLLVAKTQLTAIDPELGALIPDDLTDAIVSVETSPLLVDAAQLAEDLRLLAFVLSIASLGLFTMALWISPSPTRAVFDIGVSAVGAAVAVLILEWLARLAVTSSFDNEMDADLAGIVWDVFLNPVQTWALALAGIGAVIAAVAWFGVDVGDLRARFDQLAWATRRRTSTRGRIAWGVVVVLTGLVLIAEWNLAVRLIVTATGAALAGIGAREVAVAVFPQLAGRTTIAGISSAEGMSRLRRTLLTAGLFVSGVVLVAAIWRSGGSEGEVAGLDVGCNGSVALCDRSLDQVVLAATHNSNAAASEGYSLGYQAVGIVPQLEDGIRALLIDVYFGLDAGDNVVITDRAPITAEQREELVEELGESAVSAAEATAVNAATAGQTGGLYLCHAFCELGATDFVEELERIREYLTAHQTEVIVMIIQDEGPQPVDIAEAFERSGLLDLVYTPTDIDTWPTLGAMIDADERLVVAAENDSGEFDWYLDAFTITQDTPFKFESIEDFNCDPNRGSSESPLLLVNHWLSPTSPSAADIANDARTLETRVEQCVTERGRQPNLIAVDFHDRGDLIDVVDRLNGL